jgi:hypothetical protein
MGFDLFIELRIPIDKTTGQPSVWGKSGFVPFVPSEYVVPKEFLPFIKLRGFMFFSAYIEILEKEGFEADCSELLENYPEWEDVVKNDYYEDWWEKEDHDQLKVALTWFSSKGYFYLGWTY